MAKGKQLEEKKREIGRTIGWDYARYGIKPFDDVQPSVLEGYESGKTHYPNPRRLKEDEPYIKKWLQLRRHALDRNKLVVDSADYKFIRSIFYPKCPVTLVELTRGHRAGTDWSIDRLNNNGAYADGNLAVMSTKANRAKGSKSFDEVYALAKNGNDEERVEGLTRREWLRMACIMYGACATEIRNPVHLPLATFLPKKTAMPAWFSFQNFLLQLLRPEDKQTDLLTALKDVLDDASLQRELHLVLNRLLERLKICEFPYDALVDKELQDGIYALASGLSVEQYHILNDMVQNAIGSKPLSDLLVDSWSLNTRGLIIGSSAPKS